MDYTQRSNGYRPNELANTYSELAGEELLRMHASGYLTELTRAVLEKELTHRGISIPLLTEVNTSNKIAK